MSYVQRTLSLYLTNRLNAFVIPPVILLVVAVIMVIVGLIIGIRAGLPIPEEISAGFAYNQAVLWAMPGFLISHGVLTANRGLSGALAFGSTRGNFWWGTASGFVITSLVVTAVGLVLLGIEALTGYGVGVRYLQVAVTDNGNPLVLAPFLFLLCLASLFIGMTYGGIFRSYGVVWTVVSVLVSIFVLLGLVAVIVAWPQMWLDLLQEVGRWAAPVIAAVFTVIGAIASRVVIRYAEI